MKKLNLFYAAILIAGMGLFSFGCSVNPSKVDAKYAQEFISKVTYVEDKKTGICYAIVATRMTGQAAQNSISFTWVPRELAEKYIVNK